MAKQPKTTLGRAALARVKAMERKDMDAARITTAIVQREIAKRDAIVRAEKAKKS